MKKKIIYLESIILLSMLVISCGKDAPDPPVNYLHPCPGLLTVTYEGKVYHTVQIGHQCWLKENLDVGTYTYSDTTGWTLHSDVTDNGVIEKYCYGNDAANCNVYGGIYDWREMMKYTTGEKAQGICPPGFHIPSYGEMDSLVLVLGGYVTAGKQMKPGGSSGFNLLFGGDRCYLGEFDYEGVYGNIWTSTQDDSSAFCTYIAFDTTTVSTELQYKETGHHVRCIKD